MSMNAHRLTLALTTVAGGVAAAAAMSMALSNATARADEYLWYIQPAGPETIISESGMPPFSQTVLEQGGFAPEYFLDYPNGGGEGPVITGLLQITEMMGSTNDDFVVTAGGMSGDGLVIVPTNSVIDTWSFGGGFENIYADLVGLGTDGGNKITDELITPFGAFDIPTTFDAAAFEVPAFPTSAAALDLATALEPGAFTSALEADWAALVALF